MIDDDYIDVTASVAEINEALTVGARTRERTERAAVHILTTAGCGDLVGSEVVRESIYRHPSTGAWLLDWQTLSGRRFQAHLSTGERACVELACALATDAPVRFLGSSIARMDVRARVNVLHALTIAFGPEED